MRYKLQFHEEFCLSQPLQWIVFPSTLKTVKDLEKHIKSTFRIGHSVQLSIDGFVFPRKSALCDCFQKKDIIIVSRRRKHKKHVDHIGIHHKHRTSDLSKLNEIGSLISSDPKLKNRKQSIDKHNTSIIKKSSNKISSINVHCSPSEEQEDLPMIIEHRKDLSEKLNADDLENCALKPMVDIVYRQDNTTHKCGFNRIERMRKRRKEQKKKKKLKIKEEKEQERLRQCAEYEEEMKRKQNETIQKNEKVQIPLKHLVFELETEEYATHSQTPTSSPEAQDQAEELPEPNSFPISPSPLLSSAAMSSSSSCCSSPQTTSPSPSATSEPFFSEVDLSAHFIPTKTEKMADDLCYQEENDQSGTKKTRLTNHSHYQEEMQANTSIEKNQSADETYEPGTNLSINTLRKKMSEEGTFSEVVFENHDELLEEGEIDSDKEAIENETLMVNEKFVDTLEIITKKGCSINFEKAIEQLQVI